MNEKNTGAFIATLRKERTLTQKQLAERLNVSDKAVSKWETGRGYPDIDSLMALSCYFGVTVNELLMGERLRSEKKEKEAQKSIAAQLIDEKKRRRRTLWLIAVIVVLTVAFMITWFFGMNNSFGNMVAYLQQDSVCHISADYSHIEISGVSYTRIGRKIDDLDYTWEQDRLLCDKPMVGDRLSSTAKIYSVKFCDNYDYICLVDQDSFDGLIENAVYCKSEKIDEYNQSTSKTKRLYCVVKVDDHVQMEYKELSERFSQAVDSLTEDDCFNNWRPELNSLTVFYHYEHSPLLYLYGDLGEEKGRYFIMFSENADISATGDQTISKDKTYRLNESVSEELNALFPTENRR